MKKLLAALLCLTALVFGASCQKSAKPPPKGYAFGVIESDEKNSWICFYDQNMNLLGEQKLSYGDVCNSNTAIIKNGNLYTDIYGTDYNPLEKALCLNNASGQQSILDTGAVSVLSLCANDDALFLSNNLNATPKATRYDFKTGTLSSFVFDTPHGAGAGDIAVSGDTLYGITDHVDESSHVHPLLYEIDAGTMKLKRKTDLGKFDHSVGLTATKDGLYFVTCNAYEQKVTISKGIPSYGLHFYAKATGQVESYRLSNGFPRLIEPWGDLLVIAHGDADEGKTITWFDTKTKREVGHVTLEHTIFHMHVQGDSLYVMDYSYDSEGAHSNMYRYTMAKDGTAALQAKGSVYQHGKSSSHINSFFVNEPT